MIKCFVCDEKKMYELNIEQWAWAYNTDEIYLSINCFSINKASGKFDGNIYGLVTSNMFFIFSPKCINICIPDQIKSLITGCLVYDTTRVRCYVIYKR